MDSRSPVPTKRRPSTSSSKSVLPALRSASTASSRTQSSNGSQSSAGCGSASLSQRYPPYVSAQAWAVTEKASGQLLYGSLATESREIASLTKVMTCFVALKLMQSDAERLNKGTIVPVSRTAAGLIGTSARLREGDELYLWDALHGMMLPSGNDAAFAIAEFLGRYLRGKQGGTDTGSRGSVAVFIKEMNRTAQDCGLSTTVYTNPHGLPDSRNRSCARDIGLLASTALQLPAFASIVSTQHYSCYIAQKSALFPFRSVRWTNTNRMLGEGWQGVKTGVTSTAGPCLCALSCHSPGLIVTILCSRTMDRRWSEVAALAKWAHLKLALDLKQ